MMVKKVNVLGVGISVLNLASAVTWVAGALAGRRKHYICVTGVHGVMEAQENDQFRSILNQAGLCTPDGMPMVWAGRLRGHAEMGRVYGPDLMLAVCEWGETENIRHFFLGGAPGVAEDLAFNLKKKYPKLVVAGTYTPPFRPLTNEEQKALADLVASCRPDIIWVGLSTPKQERFMVENLDRLETTLMVGVGAAFDFHSGRVRQAPRWIQRSGLEWLFRFIQEPRRLAGRYIRNNPRFVWFFLGQWLGWRKYSSPEGDSGRF